MLPAFIIILTVLGVVVCEHRNLHVATVSLLIQNILLILIFYGGAGSFAITFSAFSLIVIPLIILLAISKTKSYSEEPFIDGLTSISTLFLLISILTAYIILSLADLRVLLPLILLITGVYTMIVKADLVKLGLGLSILNNANHIFAVSMEIPVLTDASLSLVKIFTICLVMWLAVKLYSKTGSLDIRKLTILRW